MKRDLPNFICVGAGKSGTTSLYHYLRQHPDVYLSEQKELHYFSWPDLAHLTKGPGTKRSRDDWVTTREHYEKLFEKSNGKTAIGDISPSYLHAPNAASKILSELGRVKIIIMLRNPVEKVVSQYMHLRRDAREPLIFEAALDAEPERIVANWGAIYHYTETSRYSQDVNRYIKAFGRDNVKIVLFDEFKNNTCSELRSICNFLGVDDSFSFSSAVKTNRSGSPRSKLIAKTIGPNAATSFAKRILPRQLGVKIKTFLLSANTTEREAIPEEALQRLRDIFICDIKKLEADIKISTGWLK